MQLFGLNPTPASSRYFEQVFAMSLYFQNTQLQLYRVYVAQLLRGYNRKDFQINSTLVTPTLAPCSTSKMEGPSSADDKQVELYCSRLAREPLA